MTSAAITVTVNGAVPNLTVANTATAASGVCPNSTVILTASGATSYSWTGGISNGVVFTPTTATSYTVTGYNACGNTTAVSSVSVHPLPPITAVISQPSVCTGNTVVTLASGAVTYTWSHGAANGSFIYPSATTVYTVTGTSALSCTNTATVGIIVAVTPILAPVATPTIICIGSSGTLAAQGASVYNWMPGNLNTGTIVITPNVTTTYTLTKSNSNCVDVKTITVVVNQLPNVFAITSHSVVCAGSSATLSGGGANSYSWTPSSFNLVGANVAVSPTAATIYTCTGSDGTCSATYTVLVGTNPVPTLQATASSPSICAGGSVTLTGTGAIGYTWTPGGIGASIVDTPAIPTSYQLVGINSFSCTSQIQQVVIVYPNPTVNAIPNRTLVCLNGPSTITATGANTYVWSTGALTHTTLVFPPATTVYTVTGTYTNSGCSSSKTVMVQAYTPVTGINGPTAVCIGSSITISSAPANSYTWTLGGNLLSNQASIVIGPTLNTTYMLGTTSTSNNVSCVGGNSITIQVNPLPVVTASAIANRTLICKGESADLTASGGVSYNWLFVGQGSMVTVSPQNHTTYTVQGTDANGCMNTATITVRVSACIGVEEMKGNTNSISIYPNPNNGEFSISSKEDVDLELINELGQVVMEVKLNEENQRTACVKGLANGVYYTNGATRSTKIIIQKD
jgi:Secretion system C-terminal sorting domain